MSGTVIKLSNDEIKIIRKEVEKIAKKWSRMKRFVIEIGVRHNVDEELGYEKNVLLISKDITGEWGDTDLFDMESWDQIRKPIKLTEDGRGIYDFYVYEMDRGERGDLVTNAQAEFDAKGLMAIHADADKNCWIR